MTAPVRPARIKAAADFGLANTAIAAVACRQAGLPFYAACALLEKESMGRNVYGHDVGGVLSGFPLQVTRQNFLAFHHEVIRRGELSNGVGPTQITYAGALKDGHRDGGYFRQMAAQGLRPWVPADNMLFGFTILAGHYNKHHDWVTAGRLYNGKLAYGVALDRKVTQWRERLLAADGGAS